MTVLVTGGAGFIGSAVIRQYIDATSHHVVNLDALTYAGNLAALERARDHERHHFEHADICDAGRVRDVLRRTRPSAVIHLAAESHVDRSIDAPAPFIRTNVVGTSLLLDEVLGFWRSIPSPARDDFRFVHVSTDEVYGPVADPGRADEDAPYRPSSPYAASKAGSDHLARAWHRTWGLPVILTHGSNTYGPHQNAEKLIPGMSTRALAGQQLPVYGSGEQQRDWLHVEDHARGIRLALERGVPGRSYNLGTGVEHRNVDVVDAICATLDELRPAGAPHRRLIRFTPDRPGHDERYAMDVSRALTELGWRPAVPLSEGLRATVAALAGSAPGDLAGRAS